MPLAFNVIHVPLPLWGLKVSREVPGIKWCSAPQGWSERQIYFPSDTATLRRSHFSSSSTVIYMVLTRHPSSIRGGTRGK